jgi:hypothetical protein
MMRLARRLSFAYQWPNSAHPDVMPWENPDMPSGYIYFGQLVALVCAGNSATAGLSHHDGEWCSDGQSSTLSLQAMYKEVEPSDRIGIRNSIVENVPDLTGFAISNLPFEWTGQEATGTPVISRLVELFRLLHEQTVAALEQDIPYSKHQTLTQRSYGLNFIARVRCESVFQVIVKSDFLPRILHQEVFETYNLPDTECIDLVPVHQLPAEFLHVFRSTHAMIRPEPGEKMTTDDEGPVGMPLIGDVPTGARALSDEAFLKQWSRLFSVGEKCPSLSRRIGPETSSRPSLSNHLAPADATLIEVVYRDLLTSVHDELWSIPALAHVICGTRSEMARLSPLLSDDQERVRLLTNWLSIRQDESGLTDKDIHELAADPPLMLYILFEAAHDMQGTRFGILGSVIIAEVIFKALKDRRFPGHLRMARVKYSFEDLGMVAFGRTDIVSSIKRCFVPIRSVPELINHLLVNK